MAGDEIEIHEIQFVYDNTTYQGHYYIKDGILHVTSSLGSREGPVSGPNVKALATALLKDIVKAAKDPGAP